MGHAIKIFGSGPEGIKRQRGRKLSGKHSLPFSFQSFYDFLSKTASYLLWGYPILSCLPLLFLLFLAPLQTEETYFILEIPKGSSESLRPKIQDAYAKISDRMISFLGFRLPQKPRIVLCREHSEMQKEARVPLPDWALGVALPNQFLILIDLSKTDLIVNNLLAVLRHEACHLYLGAWENFYQKSLPLWLNEGIAQWVSGALHIGYEEALMDSITFKRIVPFETLKNEFPKGARKARQAYLQSSSMVSYLVQTYGDKIIQEILKAYEKAPSLEKGVELTLGISFSQLEEDWKASLTEETWWIWLWQMSNLFSLFTIMALLVIFAFWLQRRRSKRLLRTWEEEEMGHEDEIPHSPYCPKRRRFRVLKDEPNGNEQQEREVAPATQEREVAPATQEREEPPTAPRLWVVRDEEKS